MWDYNSTSGTLDTLRKKASDQKKEYEIMCDSFVGRKRGLNKYIYRQPLCYTCKHCGQTFMVMGSRQIELMNQLHEANIVFYGKKRKYYPYKYSDSQKVLAKIQDAISENKEVDLRFYEGKGEDFCRKYYEDSYRYHLSDLSKMGLIDMKRTAIYENLKEDDIQPSDQESAFSYDIESTYVVRFSENFVNYERKYGQVYFLTYVDVIRNKVCPMCRANDYKQNIVVADLPAFLFAYENENRELSWYTITDILENNSCKDMQKYVDQMVAKQKNELKRMGSVSGIHEKKDSFQLSQYIDALVLCEQGIRVLEEEYLRCVQYYAENEYLFSLKSKSIKNSFINSVTSKIQSKKKDLDDLKKSIELTDDELEDYGIFEPTAPSQPTEVKIGPPQMPVMPKSNFFSRKRIKREYEESLKVYNETSIRYEKLLKDYENEVQQYNYAMDRYKNDVRELTEKKEAENTKKCEKLMTEIQELNLLLKNPDKSIESKEKELVEYSFQDVLAKELDSVKEELIIFLDNKNKLLSLGILYPKYDNLIALTRFQEYLITGRCKALEGADGAYNLFEKEYRADMIIKKLDDISDKLEQIKENQYQLYYVVNEIQENQKEFKILFSNAFKDINDTLNSIKQQGKNTNAYLNVISNNSSLTAYNTARTSYYAKKNNQILNLMGILMI